MAIGNDETYSYGYDNSSPELRDRGAGEDDKPVFRDSETNPLSGSAGGTGNTPTLTCNRATGEGCSCLEPHCANCMTWGSSRDEQMCLKCRDGRAYMNGRCLKKCPASTWVSDDTLDVGRECLMHAVAVDTRISTTVAPAVTSRGAPVTTEQAAAVASIGKKEVFLFLCSSTSAIEAPLRGSLNAAFTQYIKRLVGGRGLDVIAVHSAISRQLTIVVEANTDASRLLGRHINSNQLAYTYTSPNQPAPVTLNGIAGSWERVEDASKLLFLSETTSAPQPQVASTPQGISRFANSIVMKDDAADAYADADNLRAKQSQSNMTVGLTSVGLAIAIGLGYFVYYKRNQIDAYDVNQRDASFPSFPKMPLEMDGYVSGSSGQNASHIGHRQQDSYNHKYGGKGSSSKYHARLENFVNNGVPLPPPRPSMYRSESGTLSPLRSPRSPVNTDMGTSHTLLAHGIISPREEVLLSSALDAIRSPVQRNPPMNFRHVHVDDAGADSDEGGSEYSSIA